MSIEICEKEIKRYTKLKIIGDLVPIKEHIKYFEKKYGLSYDEFEKQISETDEEFERWDDYIEWKAYQKKIADLNKSLDSIENE